MQVYIAKTCHLHLLRSRKLIEIRLCVMLDMLLMHIQHVGVATGSKTDKLMGVSEMLLGTSVCGIVFALFSAQPLIIIGATGPIIVFEEALYKVSHLLDICLVSSFIEEEYCFVSRCSHVELCSFCIKLHRISSVADSYSTSEPYKKRLNQSRCSLGEG